MKKTIATLASAAMIFQTVLTAAAVPAGAVSAAAIPAAQAVTTEVPAYTVAATTTTPAGTTTTPLATTTTSAPSVPLEIFYLPIGGSVYLPTGEGYTYLLSDTEMGEVAADGNFLLTCVGSGEECIEVLDKSGKTVCVYWIYPELVTTVTNATTVPDSTGTYGTDHDVITTGPYMEYYGLHVGGSVQLPVGEGYTYAVSDESVGTVDENGCFVMENFTAACVITVYDANGRIVYNCTVRGLRGTVVTGETGDTTYTTTTTTADPSTIVLSERIELAAGDTYSLPLNGLWDADWTPVYSDETICTVDADGILTALKDGYGQVFLYENGTSTLRATVHVIVGDSAPVERYTENLTMQAGDTVNIFSIGYEFLADDRPFTASADSIGIVEALANGDITALQDGYTSVFYYYTDAPDTVAFVLNIQVGVQQTHTQTTAETNLTGTHVTTTTCVTTITTTRVDTIYVDLLFGNAYMLDEEAGSTYLFTDASQDVCTCSESGLITAIGAGEATLNVLNADGDVCRTYVFVVGAPNLTSTPVIPGPEVLGTEYCLMPNTTYINVTVEEGKTVSLAEELSENDQFTPNSYALYTTDGICSIKNGTELTGLSEGYTALYLYHNVSNYQIAVICVRVVPEGVSSTPGEILILPSDPTRYEGVYMGDLNADNKRSIADMVLMARMVAQDASLSLASNASIAADFNKDGFVDAADITMMGQYLCGLITF